MVVPVFITNCQVSEKLKTGPVMIHIIITRKAMIKAAVLPDAFVAIMDIFSNPDGFLGSFFFMCKSLNVTMWLIEQVEFLPTTSNQ